MFIKKELSNIGSLTERNIGNWNNGNAGSIQEFRLCKWRDKCHFDNVRFDVLLFNAGENQTSLSCRKVSCTTTKSYIRSLYVNKFRWKISTFCVRDIVFQCYRIRCQWKWLWMKDPHIYDAYRKSPCKNVSSQHCHYSDRCYCYGSDILSIHFY